MDKRVNELVKFKCNISKNGDWQAKGVKEEPRCKLSTKGSKDHLVRNPKSCDTHLSPHKKVFLLLLKPP